MKTRVVQKITDFFLVPRTSEKLRRVFQRSTNVVRYSDEWYELHEKDFVSLGLHLVR